MLCLQPALAGRIYRLQAFRGPCRKALLIKRHFCPFQRSTREFAAQVAVGERQEYARAPIATGFEDLGLSPELLNAIQEREFPAPTEIQAAAIPQILRGGDLLLASHTGSGKTLAYLLPLVKKLKDSEDAMGIAARPKRPRALVLGPTRELTDQILGVAKMLSHHAKFRSACVNGGGTASQQAATLERPLDILIGTPQKIMQQAERSNLYFGDVEFVILDEADTMFDKGFGPEVRAVLKPVRTKANPAECILVLATLKEGSKILQEIQRLLTKEFPSMRHVKTKSLHKGVSTAQHHFIRVPGSENKLDHLSQVVEADAYKGRRVMVFCNTLDSCRAADYFLRDRGLETACCHGDVPLDGRREAIQRFTSEDGSGETPVFVCTDLAARGLDMPARVDHVVNFDFPQSPVDYIHRAGRTARAGMRGKVTSLLQKRDLVLGDRIEDALRNDRPLDDLSANRRELPTNMRPKPETLRRRKQERKAEQHARKGKRGAARFQTPPTGKSAAGSRKTSRGPGGTFASKLASSGTSGRDFGGRYTRNSDEDKVAAKNSKYSPKSRPNGAHQNFKSRPKQRIRSLSFKK